MKRINKNIGKNKNKKNKRVGGAAFAARTRELWRFYSVTGTGLIDWYSRQPEAVQPVKPLLRSVIYKHSLQRYIFTYICLAGLLEEWSLLYSDRS